MMGKLSRDRKDLVERTGRPRRKVPGKQAFKVSYPGLSFPTTKGTLSRGDSAVESKRRG
jgi:hypothetical protein